MSNRHMFDTGTRVQPKHYTKEGYDTGTIVGWRNGGIAIVRWDDAQAEYDENLSDLALLPPEDERVQTLEEEFGCDPWDDENYGEHPASAEPPRVTYARRW